MTLPAAAALAPGRRLRSLMLSLAGGRYWSKRDGTDRQTDGRTCDRYIDPAIRAASVMTRVLSVTVTENVVLDR